MSASGSAVPVPAYLLESRLGKRTFFAHSDHRSLIRVEQQLHASPRPSFSTVLCTECSPLQVHRYEVVGYQQRNSTSSFRAVLGRVNLHFIRESLNLREDGSLVASSISRLLWIQL